MMQNFLARMGDASVRGALFMSAGSTLPIHLMPMIIDGMRKDNMSGALAGGVLGAFLLGFCTVAAALPLLGIKNISQRWGWLALAMLPLWVLASANLHAQALLLPWFGVGLTCGALQCMANLMVADAPDKHVAFSARLAVTLVGNGLIALLLQLLVDLRGLLKPFGAWPLALRCRPRWVFLGTASNASCRPSTPKCSTGQRRGWGLSASPSCSRACMDSRRLPFRTGKSWVLAPPRWCGA